MGRAGQITSAPTLTEARATGERPAAPVGWPGPWGARQARPSVPTTAAPLPPRLRHGCGCVRGVQHERRLHEAEHNDAILRTRVGRSCQRTQGDVRRLPDEHQLPGERETDLRHENVDMRGLWVLRRLQDPLPLDTRLRDGDRRLRWSQDPHSSAAFRMWTAAARRPSATSRRTSAWRVVPTPIAGRWGRVSA